MRGIRTIQRFVSSYYVYAYEILSSKIITPFPVGENPFARSKRHAAGKGVFNWRYQNG